MLAALISFVAAARLQSTDVVALQKLSGAVPSPDETRLVYSTSQYDMKTNKKQSKIIVLNLQDRSTREIGKDCHDPFWITNGIVGALCSGQVWSAYLNLPIPIWTQVTKYPVSLSTAKFHIGSKLLAFSADVSLDGTMQSAAMIKKYQEQNPETGVVYDSLYVRHWDNYINPWVRHQLFVVKLAIGLRVTVEGEAINLLKGTDLETPVPPLGGSGDYNFNPDGQLVAFTARVPSKDQAWNTNQDIFIVPVTGDEEPISISEDNLGADTTPRFSPDGFHILWLQMRTPGYESDQNKIVYYNLATAKMLMTFVNDWDKSPSDAVFMNPDVVVLTVPDEGRTRLYTLHIADNQLTPLTNNGSFSSAVATQSTIYALADSVKRPSELFSINLEGEITQLTYTNEAALEDKELSDLEEFWFQSHDFKAHALVLKPVGYDETKTWPLAFLIHGGPEGFWGDSWSYRWNPQMWAAAGYFVVMVNPEGSTSYGQNYTRAILGNWGGAPYETLMTGLDQALAKYPQIDKKRICGAGASYGGYMINWINTQTDRFACLVSHDGMFNTVGSYYATEELYFPESEFLGTPWTSRQIYERWNPVNYAQQMKTPALIIHGEKDYRLPVTEGLGVFSALQRRGIPSKLLYFANENHWVLQPGNWIQWQREILEWMHQWTSE
ncbi:Alpha/Beta hydrolase protein [Gorgonomyces haynaldii]|nr:Alpha/Beta hydrolase protein [Gorgonomyces haynaldii]